VNEGLRASDGTFVAPQSPKWTAMLAGNYNGPEIYSAGHIFGRAEAQYTSSKYPQAADPLPLLNSVQIPSMILVNARVGFGGIKAGPTEIEVAGYVKNATNVRNEAFGSDLAADFAVTFQRAREYGVDLSVKF
jgi:TonB dependent receptor